MSTALTTATRFKTYAGIASTAQDALIQMLIPMVSAQIERYLRRTLESTTYKMWLDGTGGPVLRLSQYPITAIYQVCVGSSSVATITNNSETVSMASVSCDGTKLVLVAINTDGTETITDVAFSSYKTIGAIQTYLAGLSGWSLTLLDPAWSTKPSSLLRPIYGQNAYDPSSAELVMPDGTVQTKIVNEDMIEIINSDLFPSWDIFPMTSQPNRMSALQPGITPPTFSYGFPPGTQNVFAWFKAGYVLPSDTSEGTLPPGLELIVHQIMQDTLLSTKLNSNISSESIGDYSYSLNKSANGSIGAAIENRKRDLNRYRVIAL